MANEGLRWFDEDQQLDLVTESLHDTRNTLPTGVAGIDSLLRRGGLLPGSFSILGGRTGTRKTSFVINLLVSLAQASIPVGFVGLDEPPWMYVTKFMSAWSRQSLDHIEQVWDQREGIQLRNEYREFARHRLHVVGGRRPTLEHIESQVELMGMGQGEAPALLVIDYLALMARNREYGWDDNKRIPRIAEELSVWSTDSGIAMLVLHQLSRTDEHGNANNRNQGHMPMSLTQLKFAGEEPADMVFGTYRPCMDPVANMEMYMAKQVLGDRFDEDEWYDRRAVVKRTARSTFLQMLKNRPGVHREEKGVELLSPNDSLWMTEKEAEEPEYDKQEETVDERRA